MSLLYYEALFSGMNVHMARSRPSPHKVAMVLAVTDLIEDGSLSDNRIEFNESLLKAFAARFKDLKKVGDSLKPVYPFFHLRKEGFWHHWLKPGRSESYHRLQTVTSRKQIDQHIKFAYLDDQLFELLKNVAVRDLLRAALLENMTITGEERRTRLQVNGWDWLECEACVQDYFDMLGKELRNEPYNKTAHRNALMTKLRGRSEGSIERKHQNISAILVELGFTYISGYKPLFNYQAQLRQAVLAQLAGQSTELEVINSVQDVDSAPYVGTFDNVLDRDIPDRIDVVRQHKPKFLGRHINYARREAENRRLGEFGEKFVVDFEQHQLRRAGREDLAIEVEWSSNKQGDGLGFDVKSFQIGKDGVPKEEELYIEVKTTRRGKYQPFYISQNEVEFSQEYSEQFCLYRVYDFYSSRRQLFQMPGRVEDHISLNPVLYRAAFQLTS